MISFLNSNKFAVIFVMFVCMFSGCFDTELDTGEGTRPPATLSVNVAIMNIISGNLYCEGFNSNDHFLSAPDWSISVELKDFTGVQEVVLEVPLNEVNNRSVYLRTWIDENNNQIPDDDEYFEYYGNVAKTDLLSSARSVTPIILDGSEKADVVLDKKVNSPAHLIPSDGIEINAYFPEPAGNWLICCIYKGSGGSVWKAQDWIANAVSSFPDVVPSAFGQKIYNDCTQSVFANGGIITYAINSTSIGAESGVYFHVRGASAASGSNPVSGYWLEYYNNKNATQAMMNEVSTIPVGSAMDVVLDIRY